MRLHDNFYIESEYAWDCMRISTYLESEWRNTVESDCLRRVPPIMDNSKSEWYCTLQALQALIGGLWILDWHRNPCHNRKNWKMVKKTTLSGKALVMVFGIGFTTSIIINPFSWGFIQFYTPLYSDSMTWDGWPYPVFAHVTWRWQLDSCTSWQLLVNMNIYFNHCKKRITMG